MFGAESFSGSRENNNAETLAQENAARQQRKLIGVFVTGDGSLFDQHDININNYDSVRRGVLDKIRSGKIGSKEERAVIGSIKSPIQHVGAAVVCGRLEDKRELKILGAMVGEDENSEKWSELRAVGNLRYFIDKYPTPVDFEGESASFLAQIKAMNGPKEYAEYKKVMDGFKKKVYGKQQEYWEQMKALNAEAANGGNNETEVTSERLGFLRGFGKKVFAAFGNGNAERLDGVHGNFEYERSSEWPSGVAATKQVSRAQVRAGMVNSESVRGGLWADDSCEDSSFSRPELQMFGVFDGAGGEHGGRAASRDAVSVIENLSNQYRFLTGEHLKWVLEQANDAVAKDPAAGYATAVLAKVVERDDGKYLAYASAGDSRIYIVNADGKARQITRDEGEGKIITNALGVDSANIQQYGDIKLNLGDKVVMCSDGITGDYGADLMSDEEVGAIVANAGSAEEAAEDLVSQARKTDDRTALVFAA